MNAENNILALPGNNAATDLTAEFSDGKTNLPRVWLVDDHSDFRGLLSAILGEQEGFSCEREFANPAELLEALKDATAPDIILLDIQMGQYNGLNAIRPIKAIAGETHVMMLTTLAQPGSRERAFREGASDFILKSSTPSQIARRMRQAMEFGAAAGLLTTFLEGGACVAANERVAKSTTETVGGHSVQTGLPTTIAERWATSLRGLLKFSPSRG